MLTFDPTTARQADQISSAITETGKYVGTITRAEKLLSPKGTQGLGLSFKTDNEETADYLDLYTTNASGESLPSMKVVQAILGCLGLRQATDGKINCEKYNRDSKRRESTTVDGYPELMGRRIGLLLQRELSTNNKTGADVERMIVVGVFQHDTELTVSEILARKTTPEKLTKMVQQLASRPVRDSRKHGVSAQSPGNSNTAGSGFADFTDDIPFLNVGRGIGGHCYWG